MGPNYKLPTRRHKARTGTSHDKGHAAGTQQAFDQETGQVYQETEVAFKKRHNTNWIGELRTPSIAKRPMSSDQGTRSLLETMITKCAREIRNLTPQHFETVPWPLASAVWDEIVSSHHESFHAWRTLAAAYHTEADFRSPEHRYFLHIRQPPLPAQEYFQGISSADDRWLTALRVSPKQLSIPDLVAVANVRNLTVLDLSDGQRSLDIGPVPFDERIVRTWAELASAGKAFARLQVLMLGWQDNVAEWLFKYIACFPSLCHMILTDCKNMHQKNRVEWETVAAAGGWVAHHAKKSVKLLRPLLDDKKFYNSAISSLYYYSQGSSWNLETPHEFKEEGTLPLLECWLGTPRPWAHILDEYPGTRTIWFEKTKINSTIGTDTPSEPSVDTDSAKRTREIAHASQSTPSPPHKRLHKKKHTRGARAPVQTATDLLADMGVGARSSR